MRQARWESTEQRFVFYGELRGAVVYAFENRIWDMTVTLELFLEVYSAFTQEELPGAETVKRSSALT